MAVAEMFEILEDISVLIPKPNFVNIRRTPLT